MRSSSATTPITEQVFVSADDVGSVDMGCVDLANKRPYATVRKATLRAQVVIVQAAIMSCVVQCDADERPMGGEAAWMKTRLYLASRVSTNHIK
jgi:hypothetical protein